MTWSEPDAGEWNTDKGRGWAAVLQLLSGWTALLSTALVETQDTRKHAAGAYKVDLTDRERLDVYSREGGVQTRLF